MMLKMIKIKLDAQPGIDASVKNLIYKIERTDKKHTKTPNKESFNIRTDKESK